MTPAKKPKLGSKFSIQNESAAVNDFWQGPGRDVIFEVSKYLPGRDWSACRQVSRDWKQAADHQTTLEAVFGRPTTLTDAFDAARINDNYFSGRHRALITPEMPEPCSVTFASSHTLLAVGAHDKVYLGDVNSLRNTQILSENSYVRCVAFEPGDLHLAAAAWDHISIWDVNTGTQNTALDGASEIFPQLRTSPAMAC